MKISVLGAGSFGTALAGHLGSIGHRVRLWARDPDFAAELATRRVNERYLDGVELPESVEPTGDLASAADAEAVLVAVPSHGFRGAIGSLFENFAAGHRPTIVSCTKGIESGTLKRMTEVAAEEASRVGCGVELAVLSGPSFAAEIGRGSPTAVVIAAENPAVATPIREAFSSPTMRLYSTTDVVGVEIAGTTKNVVAIASGVVTGLELGQNTLAALITRGLHEIVRLGAAMGGERSTFAGLAGLGDLVLTCTGGLSRNRRVGIELAAGRTLEELQSGTGMVAEGIRNTAAVASLAEQLGVEMPITEQMRAVLYEGKAPREAVFELMTRALKSESEL